MYTLHVRDAVDQQTSGTFFKARPFEITVGERRFDCVFRKGTSGKVIYALEESGVLLVELIHPYYAPEFAPDEADRFGLSVAVLETVYAALVRVGVTKDKAWIAYLQEKAYSYEVKQA